jgi:SAM-dependent methyltransferase
MNNTSQSFYDKWHKNKSLAFDVTLNEGSDIYNWILTRNGFANADALQQHLKSKQRLLDAGCGNGRVTALLRKFSNPDTTDVVGIDLVAADVAAENLQDFPNVSFRQKDLLGDLSDLGMFDFIYCQEVLHHTGDPAKAFANLCTRLSNDGEIAIYVYKQKAPVREYTDDFIRDRIASLNYEDAMACCRQITALGKALHDQDLTIRVPAVDILDIPEGEYSVQRFLYHFFLKCFWNPDFNFEDNAVINYDWFHPQNCTRHTLEEVRGWFVENNLEVIHEYVDFYGITVRGRKQEA